MRDTLISGLADMGLSLSDGAIDQLCIYGERLIEKNRVMNLTAITQPAEIAALHFLDSLSILKFVALKEARLIDVGCGAGFPGLPLKIAEPTIELTLLDSLGKRVQWLQELIKELGLEADCVHARAEEQALKPDFAEGFDFAVSRAVARLNVLAELCLPYCRVGGNFIAMKSVECREEVSEATRAIELMGGKLAGTEDYKLPGSDIVHRFIIIEKVSHTPSGFPRRFAKIKKEPIA